jgi:hypothetical protein
MGKDICSYSIKDTKTMAKQRELSAFAVTFFILFLTSTPALPISTKFQRVKDYT